MPTIVALLLLFLGACGTSGAVPVRHRAAMPPTPPPRFAGIEHVFMIILENEDTKTAMEQPTLAQFAHGGALLTNFHSLTHPSQPNYMALTSGQFAGITTDDQATVDVPNLSDLFEKAGVDWKVYAETYPGNCYLGSYAYEGNKAAGLYVRRHVPFLNYKNVQTNPARCARIVNASQLDSDIAAGQLPRYALYIPNTINDGHDTTVADADAWMKRRVLPLLNDPRFTKGTLVIVTFDEGRVTADNRIYTAFRGADVRPGAVSDARYDHYDLLRTIEEILNLGTLHANDEKAKVIADIWQ